MNVGMYLRVIWRFRLLVGAGAVLAVVLAVLAVVRVSPTGSPHFTYRTPQTWISRSTILITQQRFPEGRSVFAQTIPPSGLKKATQYAPQFADTTRFIQLADLYAQLATSDQVLRLVRRGGPLNGKVQAVPTVTVNGASSLPLLSINGISHSRLGAQRLAMRAVGAFTGYLADQQRNAGVPDSERVVLRVIDTPQRPQLLRGRPKTLPVVVFLAVLLGAVSLAMVLENLRPSVAGASTVPGPWPPVEGRQEDQPQLGAASGSGKA